MENLKQKFLNAKEKIAAAGLALAASPAFADLATSAQAGIDAAKTDGLTVGGYIVGAVAALAVVGVVINLIKRM